MPTTIYRRVVSNALHLAAISHDDGVIYCGHSGRPLKKNLRRKRRVSASDNTGLPLSVTGDCNGNSSQCPFCLVLESYSSPCLGFLPQNRDNN
jgi:hypothetical protein